jgi:hypothetical protein
MVAALKKGKKLENFLIAKSGTRGEESGGRSGDLRTPPANLVKKF